MIAPSAVEQATPVAPESPYKGLVPFEDSELDALLFFGRELEREVIAANLLASRLTVLYGPSGVGKSSLLRAGVAHHLRREAERNLAKHGHPELAVATFANWSEDPVAGIRAAAQRALASLFGAVALDELDGGDELADAFETWTSELGCDLLLVLDQAEEYFLYHHLESGRQMFAEQLPELVTRPGLRVHVLLAVREDSLAALDFFKGRIPNLFANYLRLDHLDRTAGRRAIVGPLERYNDLASPEDAVAVEPALVDAVLSQVEAGKVAQARRGRGAVRRQSRVVSRVEAPYLQLVMQRLWEVERAEGSSTLRLATLERLGGASRITEEHLERALGSLSAEGREVAALMFHHLVTPSGTKIAHRTADLAEYAHVPADQVRTVVGTLASERILRPVDGRGTNGGAAHEIFHDVLAEAVVAWRTRHDTEMQLARQREEARRRSRRLAAIVAVALAGLAAMTVVAVYAFAQRSEAREQAAASRVAQREALAQAGVARAERREADRQTKVAQHARRRATRSAAAARAARKVAQVEAANARAAEKDERIQAAAAERGESRATSEAARARRAEGRYRAQRDVARAARDDARRQTRLQLAQRRLAQRQTRLAKQQSLRRRVGELTARSNALLDENPERSLRLALNASSLQRSDAVEDALREALVAIRVRAELRGNGPIQTAVFSRDGRLILAVGGREARVYGTRPPRLLRRFRHPAAVDAAAFSPDGRVVVTAGRDARARIWSVETGVLLHVLAHPNRVTDVVVADDGRVAVTAGRDGVARVWHTATGLLLHEMVHAPQLQSLDVSPDGRLVLTAAGENAVAKVFDVRSGLAVADLRQQGEVTAAAFSPTGDVVATAGRRNAYLWNTGTWQQRHLLVGHSAAITDVSFSADGRRVLTTSVDSSARLWDVQSGDTIQTFIGHHQQRINAGAVSPTGDSIVTASNDGTARLSAAPLGTTPMVLAGHGDRVTHVAFSRDGSQILTASDDGSARLWDAQGSPQLRPLGSHDGAVTVARFSRRGDLVVSAGADGTARIWGADGGLRRTLRHRGAVSVAFFTGSDRVLTASQDGTAVIWRVSDGVQLVRFPHGAPIRAAAVARSGEVVTAGDDRAARFWTPDGKLRASVRHEEPIVAAVFSPDGRLAATASSDDSARLWRAADGRLVHTLRAGAADVTALAFSPDGRVLATAAGDGSATLWRVTTGRRVRTLARHSDALTSISYSRDGRRLLTTSVDGDARSWTADGRPVNVFRAHVATVAEAAFSPDRRWVATAGPSTAGLFQARTGRWLFFVRGHTAPVRSVSFSPHGRRILTASTDGTVRFYRCTICAPLAELRALARARLRQIARPAP